MSAASPRPPPPEADEARASRASEGPDQLGLPAGSTAILLSALCHPGFTGRPYAVADGWAWYRWEHPDGGTGHVGLRTAEHPDHTEADDLAAQALAEAPTRHKGFGELAALVTRLVELDGVERQWKLERVAELLYGPARPSSHRERQLPPLHRWLALMERGLWRLDAPAPVNRAGRRSGTRRPSASVPTGAQPLLSIERATRCSATVRLDPRFAERMATTVVAVPSETFRLPQDGHHNPHGNRPSLATRVRTRIGAVYAYALRHGVDEPLDLGRLLERYAGVDLAPVTRRRRLATWFDDLTADLAATGARLGVGLATLPKRARRVLATALHLVAPIAQPPRQPASAATQARAPRPPP